MGFAVLTCLSAFEKESQPAWLLESKTSQDMFPDEPYWTLRNSFFKPITPLFFHHTLLSAASWCICKCQVLTSSSRAEMLGMFPWYPGKDSVTSDTEKKESVPPWSKCSSDYLTSYLSWPLSKPIQSISSVVFFLVSVTPGHTCVFRPLHRNTHLLINPSSLSSRSFKNVIHFWKMQLM